MIDKVTTARLRRFAKTGVRYKREQSRNYMDTGFAAMNQSAVSERLLQFDGVRNSPVDDGRYRSGIHLSLIMGRNRHSGPSSSGRSSKTPGNISGSDRRVHVPQARTIPVHSGSSAARPILRIRIVREAGR